jgi:hypothetical protein
MRVWPSVRGHRSHEIDVVVSAAVPHADDTLTDPADQD